MGHSLFIPPHSTLSVELEREKDMFRATPLGNEHGSAQLLDWLW